jgi:hypothetical protein
LLDVFDELEVGNRQLGLQVGPFSETPRLSVDVDTGQPAPSSIRATKLSTARIDMPLR